MAVTHSRNASVDSQRQETIAYIRQLIGELRQLADRENAELLRYFLEMAYLEAGDLMTARQAAAREVSSQHGQ